MSKISISTLHVLKLLLQKLGVASLLLNLLVVILAQVSNAIFELVSPRINLMDPESELLVETIKVGTCLNLLAIAGNNLIMDLFAASNRVHCADLRSHLLRVLDDSRSRRGALSAHVSASVVGGVFLAV